MGRDMGPILAEISKLKEFNRLLILFSKEVIQTAFEGCGLDGGDIQELGVKHGLLVEEKYDQEKHGDEWNWDFEPGELIYIYSEIIK